MKYFLTTIVLFLFLTINAQNISIVEDMEVSQSMDHYVAINKSKSFVPGWRIQLLATTDRREMERERANFIQKYPYISIDWLHASPYYKLQAGAYASKLEATRVLYIIERDYPSAYTAKDKTIRPGEFIGLRY